MSLSARHLSFSLLVALACSAPPSAEPAAPQNTAPIETIVNRDWVLVALSTSSTIIDSTRPPTLRLAAAARASGFAGCNQYSAGYSLRGDSLTFGPIAATRMYCAASDHLERVFLSILGDASTYRVRDSTLMIVSRSGLEAYFRAAR